MPMVDNMMANQVTPEEREFFVGELSNYNYLQIVPLSCLMYFYLYFKQYKLGELTNYIYLLAAPPLLLFLMVPSSRCSHL